MPDGSRGGHSPAVLAQLDQAQALIRDTGWAIQLVPADESAQGHTYAYSVGLMSRGCECEVVVVGLALRHCYDIINAVAAQMVTPTATLPPSEFSAATFPVGVMVARRYVTRPDGPVRLHLAEALYDMDSVPVVQYLWHDQFGRYPNDPRWMFGDVQATGTADSSQPGEPGQ